jgi:hypothetical protein
LILRDGSCIAKLANAKENSEFRRRGRGAHAAMEGGTRNWIAIERCIYRHAETGQVRNDGGWEGPLSGVRARFDPRQLANPPAGLRGVWTKGCDDLSNLQLLRY